MRPIEAVKNLCSYLFLGRCRKHGRDLAVVRVDGHCASTVPLCVECHPDYRGQQVEISAPATAHAPVVRETAPVPAAAGMLTEVEVG